VSLDELTSTEAIVALAAAGVALIALLFAIVLAVKVRRLRRAQSAVMGDDGQRDLVAHAARMETGFTDLREWVEDAMTRLDQRMGTLEERVDGCVAYTGLVRYDAYNELSGRQSSSVALLDTRRSGVVISSIHHRDQARIYVKKIVAGESELDLSPEEREAIETALAGPAQVSAA
jgi:hypothetical protein